VEGRLCQDIIHELDDASAERKSAQPSSLTMESSRDAWEKMALMTASHARAAALKGPSRVQSPNGEKDGACAG
jgi:hypothetical protein